MFLQQLFSLHWKMKPEVLTTFSMQDAPSSGNSANWNIKLSLLPVPVTCKGQQNGEKTVPCCWVSGCPGKQFKIMKPAKKRLLKTVMDKIHGYIILTIEVPWHGRLISPRFSCLHLPNQGKTYIILRQILISHYLHPICPQNVVQPSLAADVHYG